MKRSVFAATMQLLAVISGGLSAILFWAYHYLDCGFLLSPGITCVTVFFHFSMRLLVGLLVPHRFDYRSRWFQVTKAETSLYKFLRLKRWKAQLPTYNPALFSLQEQSLEQIIRNTCQAEVVHEIIILLSFIPLLFSMIWDSFSVFFITSVLAAGFDLLFVMLQRFNRPRLVRMLELQTRRNSK